MMRKVQKTIGAAGRSSGGKSFRPWTVPFQLCVRISEPRCGISIAYVRLLGLVVGQAEQDQRRAALSVS